MSQERMYREQWAEFFIQRGNLKSYRPRKITLLRPAQLKSRLQFDKDHIEKYNEFWHSGLWTYKQKPNFLDNVSHVWMKTGDACLLTNTITTVIHRRGSLIFRRLL